jgi:ribosomal protein S11
MTTAPARPKPTPPPAKDPNAPRPYATKKTATLMEQLAAESSRIVKLEVEIEERRQARKETIKELERRDVSYRAMSAYHPDIPSNVSISRMMRADEPKPPVA